MTSLSVDAWKAWAIDDAGRRGLHPLKPLLDGLAAATTRLRATKWHEIAAPMDASPGTQAPDSAVGR